MYDLETIGAAAATVAELFGDGRLFEEAIAEHCDCGEVDRFVEWLRAADNQRGAEDLLFAHIKWDECATGHTSLHQPDPPARQALSTR
ncbi:hypothetical protein [Rhodococcus marinonascens]|uniref:hypothetical protein n=1 Tax=Rhodococcus marinonascens TaxID=38311 RepID=UPI000934880E|nr:hypothetical protein [Rhodococcus marinonascens]